MSLEMIVLLVVVVILLVWGIGIYNGLVRMRNQYENAYAQIDVQLKRRFDLIPNLIEVAKGYMAHERETLEAVIQARNVALAAADNAKTQPGNATAMAELSQAETALSRGMSGFFALAESYPDLKADRSMTDLSEEVTTTENKIAFARQAYNDQVTSYNTKIESFPDILIASKLGFQDASLLEVIEAPEEKQNVKIQF